jgi:AcrR family transcriptional regulator
VPRTRSASAHRKVLHAALELLAERGVDATSMDAIAQRSGVSKATIYKHWADKDALLLEVMADIHGLHRRPAFDTGDVRADMIAVLSYRPEGAEVRERIMPHFMAYSARNPSFGNAWRNMVMEPPRRELKRLIKRGIEAGELPARLDRELCLTLLLGPMMYWHVFLRRSAENPKELARGVVNAFWNAFGVTNKTLRRMLQSSYPAPSSPLASSDVQEIARRAAPKPTPDRQDPLGEDV